MLIVHLLIPQMCRNFLAVVSERSAEMSGAGGKLNLSLTEPEQVAGWPAVCILLSDDNYTPRCLPAP